MQVFVIPCLWAHRGGGGHASSPEEGGHSKLETCCFLAPLLPFVASVALQVGWLVWVVAELLCLFIGRFFLLLGSLVGWFVWFLGVCLPFPGGDVKLQVLEDPEQLLQLQDLTLMMATRPTNGAGQAAPATGGGGAFLELGKQQEHAI